MTTQQIPTNTLRLHKKSNGNGDGKIRILFITDNFPPETNAPATRTYEHARYWAKWGHDVTILTCAPNFPDGKVYEGYKNRWLHTEVMDGIKVVRVKTYITANNGFFLRILDYVSFMLSSFFFGLFREKPEIIVATSPQFFAAAGGWFLAMIRRVPFIFELRDLWPASIFAVGAMEKNFLFHSLERLELFLYKKSKLIIALTESFKENLVNRGIPENKIHFIPNGAEINTYSPRPKDQETLDQLNLSGKFIFGYMGTLGMAHGLDLVLKAADKLRENPKIHFLFAGSGAERENLIKMAEDMKLSNVTFAPRQPKSRILNYLSICDVALVHLNNNPVFKTVIPSKIFEAMAMGVPILLALPEGEASSIIKDTGSGLCVDPGNASKLCAAANYLYKSPGQLKEFGKAGREASLSYNRKVLAEKMISVFNLAKNNTVEKDDYRKIISKIVYFQEANKE